jgi:hypothetical protein
VSSAILISSLCAPQLRDLPSQDAGTAANETQPALVVRAEPVAKLAPAVI